MRFNKNKMDNINFSSRIKPVTMKEFTAVTKDMGSTNFVDFPWTIEESKKAKDVFTKNIVDCTACLITDGKEALLMHLNPRTENNHAFSLVLNYLSRTLDLKSENLHALLIGSKNNKKSLDIYSKFKQLLNQLSIKFSELKEGKTPVSVAYSSDNVYITGATIDKMLKKGESERSSILSSFKNVSISECDEL